MNYPNTWFTRSFLAFLARSAHKRNKIYNKIQNILFPLPTYSVLQLPKQSLRKNVVLLNFCLCVYLGHAAYFKTLSLDSWHKTVGFQTSRKNDGCGNLSARSYIIFGLMNTYQIYTEFLTKNNWITSQQCWIAYILLLFPFHIKRIKHSLNEVFFSDIQRPFISNLHLCSQK